jgi:hypothetical protein
MPFYQRIPRPFLKTAVQTYAPNTSGVYGLSNASEWVYIGETDDIQAALLTHLRRSDTPQMKRLPTGFVFEVCDPAVRSTLQDRLALEYEPVCNRRWTPQP